VCRYNVVQSIVAKPRNPGGQDTRRYKMIKRSLKDTREMESQPKDPRLKHYIMDTLYLGIIYFVLITKEA